MGMTPEAIAAAVDWLRTKNTTRLSQVQANAMLPKATATNRSASGAGTGGGGGRTSTTSRTGAYQKAVAKAQKAGIRRTPRKSKDSQVETIIKGLAPVIGPLGWVLAGAGQEDSGPINDIFEPMEKDEAPKNATQSILNALSTGVYAGAEMVKGIGDAATNSVKRTQEAGNRGDVAGVIGAQALGTAEGIKGGLSGFARGVAEGTGKRFDGKRPTTHGQNLEAIGLTGKLRESVAASGGDQGWQDFAAGALGFTADVAGDPLSWAGPSGVTKFARSATAAAGDAKRAGQAPADVLMAGVQGGVTGRRAWLDQLRAAKAAKAEQTAYRKANLGGLPPEAGPTTLRQEPPAGATQVADDVVSAETPPTPQVVDDFSPQVVDNAVETPAGMTPKQTSNAATRIDDLMATGTVGKMEPREVPADTILGKALVSREAPGPDVPAAGKKPTFEAWLASRPADEPVAVLPGSIRDPAGNPIDVNAAEAQAFIADPKTPAKHKKWVQDQLRVGYGEFTPTTDQMVPGPPVTKKGVTPESLQAAIDEALPDAAGTYDTQAVLKQLAAAKPEMRKKILQTMFQGDRLVPFKDFDEAMMAAVDGQVEAAVMRDMLRALGIKTKATKVETVRTLLATQGQLNWEQVKISLQTATEVNVAHGIDDATAEAAKVIDVEQVEAAAKADFEEAATELHVDDAVLAPVPTTNSSLEASMLRDIIKAVDDQVNPANPGFSQSYDYNTWLSTWRAAFSRDLTGALNSARNAKGGLRGAERGKFVYAKLVLALRAGEAYARATGRHPQMHLNGFDEPLYVSFSQILDEIPDELAMRAFFDLDYRLSKYGEGKTPVAQQSFRLGLTVYPTTVAKGAYAAMRGKSVDEIFEAMAERPNKFEASGRGQQTLIELAQHMDSPEFRSTVLEVHEAQKVLAVAKAQRVADEVVGDIASKVVGAAARGGDRSTMLNAIKDGQRTIDNITETAGRSLVKDMANQRTATGTAVTLGEHGMAIARSDARMADAQGGFTPAQRLTRQEKVNNARKARTGADGTQPVRSAPTGATTAEKKLRHDTARNLGKLADDLRNTIDDGVDEALTTGAYENTSREAIAAFNDQMQGLGALQWGARLGKAVQGDYGMPTLKPFQVMKTSSSFVWTHAFIKDLDMWVNSGKVGILGAHTQHASIVDRLGALTGAKIGPEDVDTYLRKWWDALAHTETHLERQLGRTATNDELAEALTEGLVRNPRENITANLEGIHGDELQMAMEFRAYIEAIFAPVDGPLARSGVATSDLMREMRHYGFGEKGSLSQYMPDAEFSLADQASIWRTYDTGLMDKPLDVLVNWHKALTAATVKPSLGAAFSKQLDHRALEPGLSTRELYARGWRQVDTDGAAGIGAYLDPDSFFPPEIFREFTYVNKFFDDMDKNMPQVLSMVVKPYDAITGVLKSSMTIWNPSHHITNVLGENAMLLMAGVNPLQSFRGIQAMRAGGKLLDADLEPLDLYRSTFEDAGSVVAAKGTGTLKDKWFSGDARVLIRVNGKLEHVDLSAADVWSRALNSGVAITARESKDLLPGVGKTTTQSAWHRFNRQNPIAMVDHKLGEFSANRDNMTRLAHFYAILEKGEYRSIDEAVSAAAREVHSYHPTIQTLSAFDQKVTRRLIYFHTWVRQAAGRIIETALERPAMVTLPSKYQYNQAEAAGMDPESIGKPNNSDPRMADYYTNSVLGPTMWGGYSPFDSPGDLPTDPETGEVEPAHMWGYSLSTPQVDALTTFFGGTSWDDNDPGPIAGTWQNTVDLLNPLLKVPAELATNSKVGGIGKPPLEDPNYLLSQTGVPYRLQGIMGGRANPNLTPEEQRGEQDRQLLNYWSGLKFTDYTNSTSESVARYQQQDDDTRMLEELGYTPEEQQLIRKVWNERRAQQGVTRPPN